MPRGLGRGPLPDFDLSADAEDFLFDHFEGRDSITRPELINLAERVLPGTREDVTRLVDAVLVEVIDAGLVRGTIARSSQLGTSVRTYSLTEKGKRVMNALATA